MRTFECRSLKGYASKLPDADGYLVISPAGAVNTIPSWVFEGCFREVSPESEPLETGMTPEETKELARIVAWFKNH